MFRIVLRGSAKGKWYSGVRLCIAVLTDTICCVILAKSDGKLDFNQIRFPHHTVPNTSGPYSFLAVKECLTFMQKANPFSKSNYFTVCNNDDTVLLGFGAMTSALKMETVCFSERVASTDECTRRQITEQQHYHPHRRANLKSYTWNITSNNLFVGLEAAI
jgi:hypothetical protein